MEHEHTNDPLFSTRTTPCVAHTSDTFGATTTSYSDADGNDVGIRVTGWGTSLKTTVSFIWSHMRTIGMCFVTSESNFYETH